jgi:vancomycin resistance protein YoaR
MRKSFWETSRRWLTITAACGMLGAGVILGTGMVPRGLSPSPDKQQTPGLGTDGKPADATTPPTSPDAPGTPSPAPATEQPAPAPDRRVLRAQETRVCLQAGKVKLWTELRWLGADLSWPADGEPRWSVDEKRFERGLPRLARRTERRPQNARLMHAGSAFKAVPGRGGQRLDAKEARRQLLAMVSAPEFRARMDEDPASKPPALTLTVPLRPVAPSVTPSHLGGINALLASYSTSLGSSSRNRRHNIQTACQAIDGTVLLPGQVFSYNDVVGPRSERTGYRTAPVIIRGELVPGTGGGICQVSSTLYNAALLADMKIVRRSHHQFPVHYVPVGRDATVAYGSLDLRFANSLPHPIALDVKTVGWRVIVHVYGSPESRRDVRLVSSRVGWTRPRVPASGGRPRPGKRVTISRVVKLPNGAVRREVVSHDAYAPAPGSSSTTSARTRRRSSYRRARTRIAGSRGAGRSPRDPSENRTTAAPSPRQPMLRDSPPL